jgi:hypothetical protein
MSHPDSPGSAGIDPGPPSPIGAAAAGITDGERDHLGGRDALFRVAERQLDRVGARLEQDVERDRDEGVRVREESVHLERRLIQVPVACVAQQERHDRLEAHIAAVLDRDRDDGPAGHDLVVRRPRA